MTLVDRGWKRLVFALVGVGLFTAILVPAIAPAQQLAGVKGNQGFVAGQGAVPLPPTPPRGAWGAVIMTNNKWLVTQNSEGQQFPIAYDSIDQFLIRWPTMLGALTEDSVVEAIGPNAASNTLLTDHVDVFEGTDQQLVTPTFTTVMPNNRPITTIDPGFNRFMNGLEIAQNTFYGWAYPVSPEDAGTPIRLHVVGHVVSRDPLRVNFLATNTAAILPSEPGGLKVTQVTRGSPSYVEKEDFVYLMPKELTERSVILSQLVVYKKMAFKDFKLP
jgi:hypothetical protein